MTSEVDLSIYTLKGEIVISLINGWKDAGLHHVGWQGKDMKGNEVGSAIYIYKLTTPHFVETRSMVLIK